jgi:hypothetical protein
VTVASVLSVLRYLVVANVTMNRARYIAPGNFGESKRVEYAGFRAVSLPRLRSERILDVDDCTREALGAGTISASCAEFHALAVCVDEFAQLLVGKLREHAGRKHHAVTFLARRGEAAWISALSSFGTSPAVKYP